MKVWCITSMKLKNKIFFSIVLILFTSNAIGAINLFNEGKKFFDNKKYEKSKFYFQKNLVFNPKDANSYLYLAKIYQIEENEREVEKNLDTALLLEPTNEEAMFMKIDIELKKSNFSVVKELKSNFEKICTSLCEKIVLIDERLKNFDVSSES